MSIANQAVTPGEAPERGRQLLNRLLLYVKERQLQPGDRLPGERELAERFSVGRNAVREALATLTALRVVEARPQSGIYLRKLSLDSSFETLVLSTELGAMPTAKDVAETLEVRAVLETQAIELACERRNDADLAAMRAILDQTVATLRAGGNIVEHDQDFHLALVSATHNDILVRVLNAFYCLTLPRRRLFFAAVERGQTSHAEHAKIVKAVAARDLAAGRALMTRHIGNARHYWHSAIAAEK
jgi:GntR family transcriptional repressor for pyruvate dehydrogenase complex